MHILINGWFTGQQSAGSGQYLYYLLPHLGVQDSTVRYSLLLPQGWQATFTLPLPTNVTTITQALPALPKNLAKLWWEQITVPWMARKIQADALWVPYWAAPWWQPVPTTVTLHDLIPLLLPDYREGILNQLYTALVAFTTRRATSIITVSHASKRDIVAHLHVPEERVHVVYHGPTMEIETPHPTQEQIRRKYNLPTRYFLYLGGFDVRKNLRGTLTAYKRYLEHNGDPSIKLVIAGKLPQLDSPFMPDPRRMAAELALNDQVRFCGWVDDQDKMLLYAGATAYLFPSLYEGFGMMILEAQTAGVPLLTSQTLTNFIEIS